jgi:hypothetical protein
VNRTNRCVLSVIVCVAIAPFWSGDSSAQRLPVPPCAGPPFPAAGDVGAAGRFAMSGDTDESVAILARISAMTEIVYWSSTRSKWRKLFKEAVALAEPDRQKRRADFTRKNSSRALARRNVELLQPGAARTSEQPGRHVGSRLSEPRRGLLPVRRSAGNGSRTPGGALD